MRSKIPITSVGILISSVSMKYKVGRNVFKKETF